MWVAQRLQKPQDFSSTPWLTQAELFIRFPLFNFFKTVLPLQSLKTKEKLIMQYSQKRFFPAEKFKGLEWRN
jgi:hypothetical protein